MPRPRRVLLFMPGDDLHKIKKGATSGVDSVIMDLEDSVAASRKEAGRQVILDALQSVDFGATERLVRLNGVSTGLTATDLQGTVAGRPDGYVLPKVETPDHIKFVSRLLTTAEKTSGWPANSIRLLAIIETARGVMNLREIAQADARLDALCFGAEDLAGDLGATRSPEGWEVFYARSAVVLAATAYGLQAIDTPYVDLENPVGLIEDARRGASMGYTGKFAIHPRHIPTILEAFTPSEAAIAAAQRLVDAYQAHQTSGTGVFALDGKMVDTPMLRAAERVLSRGAGHGK